MAAPDGSRGRGQLRRVLLVILAVLVLWVVASGVILYSARSRTVDGINRLEDASGQLTGPGILRGEGLEALAAALKDFQAAKGSSSSPVLEPWSVVPLVRQNVASIEALTAAATRVAAVGERTAAASVDILKTSPDTGPERLELLRQLETLTAAAEIELEQIDLGPDFFLVAPLGDARDQFVERLERLREAVSDARAVTQGAQQLLRGPRRYLLIAANNAEMRAGSGMLLSAGVATFADGAFSIGEMRPTPDFNLLPGAVAPPAELAELWGWIRPTEDWRNLATTPRFDVTGAVAAEMWRAATGEQVDGVLLVDPVTLQGLLAAQGPVDVDGRSLSAETVVSFLLLEQYAGLAAGDADQAARRDGLSSVARAAVDTLNTRPWNAAELVEHLGDVGRGRHILVWARDPVEQRAWEAGGIAGNLHEDSLAVSLLNVGANKIDQFMDLDATLSVRDLAEGASEATVVLRIRNQAPEDLPGYVSGPNEDTGLAPGDYQGILAVNTPGPGSLARTDAPEAVLVAGVDGPTKALAVGSVRIPRGAERIVTITFELPEGFRALRIEPSARVPAITWHFGPITWQDLASERREW